MKKYCGRVRRLCEVGHPVNKNQRPKDVALLLAAHPPQFERPTMEDLEQLTPQPNSKSEYLNPKQTGKI